MSLFPKDIDAQIDELALNIDAARQAIYDGHSVNITEIENKVGQLCQTIESLPPKDTEGCLEFLQILFGEIDRLEKDLSLQHDALTERLQLKEKGANPLFAQEMGNLDDET